MAVKNQLITDNYAIYCSDNMEILPDIRADSIDLSCYSPPFIGLYQYSSSDNDFSNCANKELFMQQYDFLIRHIERVTKSGRMTIVHCQDVPDKGNKLFDFPGAIVHLHVKCRDEKCKASDFDKYNGICGHGLFHYHDRHMIWKEPLRVAIRTRSQGLMHRQIVKDSTMCRTALADYILVFRKKGENKIPVEHPLGITRYAGSNPPDEDVRIKYKNWKDPATNKYAHYIWQKYASAFWDDIRINNVLEYKKARDKDDEKHVHPLQLDVIDRCVTLWSNKGETVLTPFMGVGSEVYAAVMLGRKGIGIELKESYFNQAVRNLAGVKDITEDYEPISLFDEVESETEIENEVDNF
jgi:DNA modification methylase